MRDLCIELDKNTENLALIGEVLGAANVNIEGLCVMACEKHSLVHLLVEDTVTAIRFLENSGIKIRNVSDVYVLSKDHKRITGKPGSFGDVCRILADHGININFGYPAENNRFVFGVDDEAKARALLA